MAVTGAPDVAEAFESDLDHLQHHRDVETAVNGAGGGVSPETVYEALLPIWDGTKFTLDVDATKYLHLHDDELDLFWFDAVSGAAMQIYVDPAGSTYFMIEPATGSANDIIQIYNQAGSNLLIVNGGGTGHILMANLPTADPHAEGELWNNAGTLKVSAG